MNDNLTRCEGSGTLVDYRAGRSMNYAPCPHCSVTVSVHWHKLSEHNTEGIPLIAFGR